MDINDVIKRADIELNKGNLKVAWELLKPYSQQDDAKKRLRWIRKKVQEQQSQNKINSDKQNSGVVTVEATEHKVHLSYSVNSVGLSPALFDIDTKGSSIEIRLNQQHPLFLHLNKAMSRPDLENDLQLRQQIKSAQVVIDALLKGWAIYEDEEPSGNRKHRVQNTREDWGRAVRNYLQEDEDDE